VKQLFRPFSIPGLTIPGNIFLAPVAGYTDRAFREICLSFGAELAFTELVSAEGIRRGNGKTLVLMEHGPGEGPVGIQLFGSDPAAMADAVPSVLSFCPAVVDINCGCPVPKVTKNGAGAALMRRPERIGAIVDAVKRRIEECGSRTPVSVKLRSGWDPSSITYREAAQAAVEAGAAFVTIHPRTRNQGYGGRAEWGHIGTLKAAIPVPVIGSGDLYSAEDARRMLLDTGCDAVMFARGAFGNPFIFRETRSLLLSSAASSPPDPIERLDTAMKHLALAVEYAGEKAACREMRKHFCAYTRGITGSARFRNAVVCASTLRQYEELVKEFRAFLA
jgi:nifR3 family TIM-barrel protein